MSDYIQIGILIVMTLTLIGIFIQIRLQNRVFKAQLLKDRFDMYWKTYDDISEQHVKSFKDYPTDWILIELYEEKYKHDDRKVRRYIEVVKVYTYLAFTYKIRSLKIPDLLGNKWVEQWTEFLLENDEFLDVHCSYKAYYPDFHEYVEKLKKMKKQQQFKKKLISNQKVHKI